MQVGIITPEQAVAVIKEQRETIKALQSRLSEAEGKLELAKEALRFYADEQANYDNDGIVYQNASHPFDADPDYGRLARSTLAKLDSAVLGKEEGG